MRATPFLGLFLVSLLPLAAVTPGDTYDAVVAEKGPPASKIAAGPVLVLTYPDAVIRLRDGKVETVKSPPVNYATNATDVAPATAPAAPPPPPAAAEAPAELEWITDADVAFERSRSAGRPLFLLFIGHDTWSNRFDSETIRQPEFQKYARKHLVVARLDRSALSADGRVKMAELMLKLGITNLPTVAVFDCTGRLLGSVGYLRGGPAALIERVEKL